MTKPATRDDNQIIVNELHPMSDAPIDGTTILAMFNGRFVPIRYTFSGWFDGGQYSRSGYFIGWIPMPIYKRRK